MAALRVAQADLVRQEGALTKERRATMDTLLHDRKHRLLALMAQIGENADDDNNDDDYDDSGDGVIPPATQIGRDDLSGMFNLLVEHMLGDATATPQPPTVVDVTNAFEAREIALENLEQQQQQQQQQQTTETAAASAVSQVFGGVVSSSASSSASSTASSSS